MYTENNHESMKTIVETFVTEETASLIYDNEQLEKWTKFVAEMALHGQKAIKDPGKSPIPFMYLKRGLVNVLSTLCPVSIKVDQYAKTPIPLEILELISLSKQEKYFDDIEIWYDDQSPDPIAIGIKVVTPDRNEKGMLLSGGLLSSWRERNFYLIGKWGDVKQSFDELKERAKKRYMEQRLSEIKWKMKELGRDLETIEYTADQHFS